MQKSTNTVFHILFLNIVQFEEKKGCHFIKPRTLFHNLQNWSKHLLKIPNRICTKIQMLSYFYHTIWREKIDFPAIQKTTFHNYSSLIKKCLILNTAHWEFLWNKKLENQLIYCSINWTSFVKQVMKLSAKLANPIAFTNRR